jgi:chromosome segregation ATPase
MTIDLVELAEWRAETDAHLARLDLVTEEHEQDLRAKRGADNKTLSAIRETQLDHGRKLDVIEGKLDNLGRDVESLHAGMGEVKGRLGKVEDKLTVIAKTQGEHTRAIAAVETRLDKMDGRLDKIDEKLDLLIARKAS